VLNTVEIKNKENTNLADLLSLEKPSQVSVGHLRGRQGEALLFFRRSRPCAEEAVQLSKCRLSPNDKSANMTAYKKQTFSKNYNQI